MTTDEVVDRAVKALDHIADAIEKNAAAQEKIAEAISSLLDGLEVQAVGDLFSATVPRKDTPA